jgi:serine/threonine protein kinase
MVGQIGQYRVFSKYRLIARLGSGGMAEVFLAVTGSPRGFSKLQVLKVLRSDLPERERADFVRMFQDEGRLAARLSHPNIVQSHEVGSEEGHEFIAMEYLEGQPLSNVQERAWRDEQPGFPLDMQLHVLCLVLEGLEYAHNLRDYGDRQLNIVHRDVSPQNVFITYSGHVKLVDFGIAKTLESSKTRAGVVKGKVPYMSPEQVLGGAIDRRADLFSVGVMLWEGIARQPMHGTASVYEILRRLVQGELPPIREAAPEVPEPLAKILDRALSPKPEQRYPDAGAFREDLVSYLEGRRMTARAIGERVSLLFADERREINEVIRSAMTEASSSSELGSGPFNAVHLLPTLKVLAARAMTNQNTGPTTAPSTTPPLQATTPPPVQMATPEPPKAPANKARGVVLLGAALALVLIFTLISRSSSKPPVPSLNAATPGPASSAGAVRVSIRAHPETATLTFDGKALGPSPYSAAQARDGKAHELVVSAAGYQPRTLNIQLDHDVDLEVGLAQTQASGTVGQAPTPSARKESALGVQRPRVSGAVPKKADDTDPYHDLPTRKGTGTKAPPLDTSESPW